MIPPFDPGGGQLQDATFQVCRSLHSHLDSNLGQCPAVRPNLMSHLMRRHKTVKVLKTHK